MASLFKRSNGKYYAQFYNSNRSPKRKRLSLRTSKKRPARRKLTELEDAYVDGQFDPWASGKRGDPFAYDSPDMPEQISAAELIDRFLQAKEREGRSQRTLDTYRGIWRRFAEEVGSQTNIHELREEDIAAYCHESSVSDSTRHKRWRHLQAVFNWAEENGLMDSAPTDEMNAPKKKESLPTPVRKDDLPKLCQAVAEEYRQKRRKGQCKPRQLVWTIPVFRWAFYTGMRASEIGRLRWKHIDTERGLIRIEKQKNGKAQTIPLIDKARHVLRHAPTPRPSEAYVFRAPEAPVFNRNPESWAKTVSRRFCEARRRSEINRELTFHDLRAGFATALADAGKSAHVIRDAMRHADLTMALKYVNVSNERLQSEMEDAF